MSLGMFLWKKEWNGALRWESQQERGAGNSPGVGRVLSLGVWCPQRSSHIPGGGGEAGLGCHSHLLTWLFGLLQVHWDEFTCPCDQQQKLAAAPLHLRWQPPAEGIQCPVPR